MSKDIQDCSGFRLPRYVIVPENKRHFLNQSDSRLVALKGVSLCLICVFIGQNIFYFVLIGCCDYYQFVLVLRYSIEKRSRQLVIFLLLILRIGLEYLILRINFAYLILRINFAYFILQI